MIKTIVTSHLMAATNKASLVGLFLTEWFRFADAIELGVSPGKNERLLWSLDIGEELYTDSATLQVVCSVELCRRDRVAIGIRNETESDPHYSLSALSRQTAISFVVSESTVELRDAEPMKAFVQRIVSELNTRTIREHQ